MGALLTWFTTFFLQQAAGQIARKALMVVGFNIVILFVVNFVTSKGLAGLSFFGVGAQVTEALQNITPALGYFWNYGKCSWGLFLCFNALLLRFAFDINMTAIKAAA